MPNTGGHGDPSGCWYNDPAGGPPIMADCGWLALCGATAPSVCACSETACTSSSSFPIDFDFHVSGSEGTGTVDLTGMFTVRLTR